MVCLLLKQYKKGEVYSMLTGAFLFQGVKQVKNKEGKLFLFLRLCDENTGEVSEVFIPEGVIIPQKIKLFTKVNVSFMLESKRFRLESVSVAS